MTRFAAPRAALLPASRDADASQLARALTDGGAPLEALILKNELGPLWHARTQADVFSKSRTNAVMLYLRQIAAQRELDTLLSAAGVPYAIFKGAGTREWIYDEPAQRVCFDIDVLVAPEQRATAARALVDAGYRLQVDPALASHEVTLTRDVVAIDLHWDLLRPGRLPASLTHEMLARRTRRANWFVLCETDALLVMLVHPVFSKHLSTSQMGLHRLADIMIWLQRIEVDWPAVLALLEHCGVKSAAWAMLTLVQMMSSDAASPDLDRAVHTLRPGRLRSAYLALWLEQDLSARFAQQHALRLLGLSVPLHDQPSGAWRALNGWYQAKQSKERNALVFAGLAK